MRNAAWDAVESPAVAHHKMGWGHMVQALASCPLTGGARSFATSENVGLKTAGQWLGKKLELANHCIEMTLFFDLDTAMSQWQSHDWGRQC